MLSSRECSWASSVYKKTTSSAICLDPLFYVQVVEQYKKHTKSDLANIMYTHLNILEIKIFEHFGKWHVSKNPDGQC